MAAAPAPGLSQPPSADRDPDRHRHRQVGFPIDGFDVALRLGRVLTQRQRSIRLFEDWLLPVCRPAYRDAVTGRDGAVDLRRATTIDSTSATEDWQAWSDATGSAMATFGRARAARWGRLPVVAVAAGPVLSGAMGIRQTFGLFHARNSGTV